MTEVDKKGLFEINDLMMREGNKTPIDLWRYGSSARNILRKRDFKNKQTTVKGYMKSYANSGSEVISPILDLNAIEKREASKSYADPNSITTIKIIVGIHRSIARAIKEGKIHPKDARKIQKRGIANV